MFYKVKNNNNHVSFEEIYPMLFRPEHGEIVTDGYSKIREATVYVTFNCYGFIDYWVNRNLYKVEDDVFLEIVHCAGGSLVSPAERAIWYKGGSCQQIISVYDVFVVMEKLMETKGLLLELLNFKHDEECLCNASEFTSLNAKVDELYAFLEEKVEKMLSTINNYAVPEGDIALCDTRATTYSYPHICANGLVKTPF